MNEAKQKVSWTLDADAIEAVRDRARRLSDETGVKVSESAAANAMLKECGEKGKRDEKASKS